MSTLTDASAFLRKRKDKRRALGAFPRSSNDPPRRVIPSTGGLSGRSSGVASPAAASSPSAGPSTAPAPTTVKVETPNPNVVEIKLFSGTGDASLRFNMAKFNSIKEFDPSSLETPLLTRKLPGPRAPPVYAQDGEGNIKARYLYDPSGAPILGPDGAHATEPTDGKDPNLIGGVDARKSTRKKAVKEVYHQDKEKMRLKREEATPWVLESGQRGMPVDGQEQIPPIQWVGRMQEATTLPSVLLINDGVSDGFRVVPLGRTYRFEPDRPFNVNDPDEANRLYEYQMKHRIYDRWGNAPPAAPGAASRPAPGGPNGLAMPGRDIKPKLEELAYRQEERAQRWERQMQLDAAANGSGGASTRPQQTVQRWEDDDKREGRKLTRGMEGGVDEELDYDFNEEFQDDEDVNTFYRDPEEEEEAKLQEERQKKEYRLANANVGDKPQIEEELSDEEDLFGENELTADGRRLKRMMKKRRDPKDEDLFGSDSDDDSDESEPESKPETPKKPENASRAPSVGPSSSERPSRPPSRTHSRNATSPIGRRPGAMSTGKAATAPPGSGHSLAAQRAASRGASPRRSRGNSPATGRGASPDDRRSPGVGPREGSPAGGGGRGMSPSGSVGRASPARETSPAIGGAISRASPAPGGGGGGGGPSRPSPNSTSSKRKSSPNPSGGEASRKKKKSSTPRGTPGPEEVPSFPGMIQRQDVVDWFRTQPELIPMTTAIGAWKDRILAAPNKEKQAQNQQIFLAIVSSITEKEPNKMLRMKADYR